MLQYYSVVLPIEIVHDVYTVEAVRRLQIEDVNLDPTATAKIKGQAAVSPHLTTRHVVARHSGFSEISRHVSRLENHLFPEPRFFSLDKSSM